MTETTLTDDLEQRKEPQNQGEIPEQMNMLETVLDLYDQLQEEGPVELRPTKKRNNWKI